MMAKAMATAGRWYSTPSPFWAPAQLAKIRNASNWERDLSIHAEGAELWIAHAKRDEVPRVWCLPMALVGWRTKRSKVVKTLRGRN